MITLFQCTIVMAQDYAPNRFDEVAEVTTESQDNKGFEIMSNKDDG